MLRFYFPGLVLGVFENVASSYDLMNDAMSLGIHRLWKDYFVSVLNPAYDTKLLDVAGGTGRSKHHSLVFGFLKHIVGNLLFLEKNVSGDIAFRVLNQMKAGSKPSTGHVTW